MIVERKIDGLLQLVGGKFHQLAGGQCDGRQAEHRNIPAAAADVDAKGMGAGIEGTCQVDGMRIGTL